jgi:hypothetical protein
MEYTQFLSEDIGLPDPATSVAGDCFNAGCSQLGTFTRFSTGNTTPGEQLTLDIDTVAETMMGCR